MPNGDGDQFAFTDDTGRSTLTGLAPGEWVVPVRRRRPHRRVLRRPADPGDRRPDHGDLRRPTTADAQRCTATKVSGTVTGAAAHRSTGSAWTSTGSSTVVTSTTSTSRRSPGRRHLVGRPPTRQLPGGVRRRRRLPRPVVRRCGQRGRRDRGGRAARPLSPASTPSCSRAAPSPAPSPVPAACRRRTPTSRSSGRTRPASSRRSGRASSRRPGPTGPTRSRPASYKVRFETFDGTLLPSTTSTRRTWRPRTRVGGPGRDHHRQRPARGVPAADLRHVTTRRAAASTGSRSASTATWAAPGPGRRTSPPTPTASTTSPCPPGEYRCRSADFDNRLFEWWNDAERSPTATSVDVAGSDVTGISPQLADGGVVTGAVTYPQQVNGWSSTGHCYNTTTGEWAGQANVDAHQNRYRIDELPTRTYRAEAPRTRRHRRGAVLDDRPEQPGPGTQTVAVTEAPRHPTSTRRSPTAASSPARPERPGHARSRAAEGQRLHPRRRPRDAESRPTGADGTFRVSG